MPTKPRSLCLRDWEVRAFLEGRKTQMRVPVKVPRHKASNGEPWMYWLDEAWDDHGFPTDDAGEMLPMDQWSNSDASLYRNQYLHVPDCHPEDFRNLGREKGGTVRRIYPSWMQNDRLWVKEAYTSHGNAHKWNDSVKWREQNPKLYEGDPLVKARRIAGVEIPQSDGTVWTTDEKHPIYVYYRASFGDKVPMSHLSWLSAQTMPQWASRLTLLVESVRVQRVGEITDDEAIAEGIRVDRGLLGESVFWDYLDDKSRSPLQFGPVDSFYTRWERDHPGSWDRNDWCWVLTLTKTVDPQAEKNDG